MTLELTLDLLVGVLLWCGDVSLGVEDDQVECEDEQDAEDGRKHDLEAGNVLLQRTQRRRR